MLQPILSELSAMKIILASGSPRRRDILTTAGLKFEVMPSNFEENLNKTSFASAFDYVKETALGKAVEVASRFKEGNRPDLIIAADTVVTLGKEILEKPNDEEHAFSMLTRLSGTTHHVHTGVVLMTTKDTTSQDPFKISRFHETTEVRFGDISSEVLQAYVATGEPLDKAGGYGYQKLGGSLVAGIQGDYYNVVGFPLHSFCRHLIRLLAAK